MRFRTGAYALALMQAPQLVTRRSPEDATAVEYGFIAALIATACIVALASSLRVCH